ncbi:MAG: nicotinate-nicotinamide nucleotide adenylyltransferase [Clostridia bacterium]|nr:nicotinate-nicotinamide nucleotide adenylyltransferase [Clostridia bacterium]
MRLGVYVGSFDPVHKGHIGVAKYLLDNNIIDKILLIPTESYWDKNDLVDIEHRYRMLKIYENEKIIVSMKYSNFRSTYQILDELTTDFDDDLYLIIGADNIIKFHLWANVEEILKHKVVVLGRNGIDMEEHIKKFEKDDSFVLLKDFPQMDISSTKIREKIKNSDFEDIEQYLDKEVIQYVMNNKLYC